MINQDSLNDFHLTEKKAVITFYCKNEPTYCNSIKVVDICPSPGQEQYLQLFHQDSSKYNTC